MIQLSAIGSFFKTFFNHLSNKMLSDYLLSPKPRFSRSLSFRRKIHLGGLVLYYFSGIEDSLSFVMSVFSLIGMILILFYTVSKKNYYIFLIINVYIQKKIFITTQAAKRLRLCIIRFRYETRYTVLKKISAEIKKRDKN